MSSNSLTTNIWFDHRGDQIKSAAVGGLVTKMKYDGAGRETKVYTTDGADKGDIRNNVCLPGAGALIW